MPNLDEYTAAGGFQNDAANGMNIVNGPGSSDTSSSNSGGSSSSSSDSSSGNDWMDRLNQYKTDSNAAQTEIQRAKDVYDQKIAAGDYAGAQEAHTWADQVRQAAGISSDDPTYGAYDPNAVNVGGVSIGTTGSNSGGSGGYMSSVPGYDYTSQMGGQGTQVKSDGTIHANVGNQSIGDIKVSNGNSYGSAQDVAKAFGASMVQDNQGNWIMTKDGKDYQVLPVGYDQYNNPMMGYRDIANRLGYQVKYDDATKTTTFTDPNAGQTPKTPGVQGDPSRIVQVIPGVGALTAGGQFISFNRQGNVGAVPGMGGAAAGIGIPGMGQLGQILPYMPQQPQITPFQAPDLSGYQSQFMPYQQFNPSWDNYYSQAHSQLDPQYQAKYNDLMSKQGTDLTRMDESMNRRGIYTSGIAEAAANDLRAKTTNAVANVFLQQQAAVNKMAQTLYQDAYKQYQSGNQMALKNNEYIMTQMLNQEKQAFTQWLGTQKLGQSQYQYAMTAWDKMATLIQNQAKMDQSADQFNQTQFMNLYKQDNLSADQQATLQKAYDQMAQQLQIAKMPYEQQTANNAANNQLQFEKMMGFDQKGNPTLDTWKALGYVRDADGKLVPTEQASNNSRNYALNLAKTAGYFVNDDGSITPTEQARHDMAAEQQAKNQLNETTTHNRATEQNAADNLKLKMDQITGYVNGIPTLDRQKYNETVNHDNEMVSIAQQNANSSVDKAVVDTLGKSLTATKQSMDAIMNKYPNGIDPVKNKADYDQLNTLMDHRNQLLDRLAGYRGTGYGNAGNQ